MHLGAQAAATHSHEAYGKPLSSGGSVYNPFGYTGEYTDSESGIIYLRARYYDPSTQQFLTVDPALASTEEAYAYASGSPTNFVDPLGLYYDKPGDAYRRPKKQDWLEGCHDPFCIYGRAQLEVAEDYYESSKQWGSAVGGACSAVGSYLGGFLHFVNSLLTGEDDEQVNKLLFMMAGDPLQLRMDDEVRYRFGNRANSWKFDGLNGKIQKLNEPDPYLGPGKNQYRIYARYRDETGEIHDISVNYDADMDMFGNIKYSSGR